MAAFLNYADTWRAVFDHTSGIYSLLLRYKSPYPQERKKALCHAYRYFSDLSPHFVYVNPSPALAALLPFIHLYDVFATGGFVRVP